MARYRHEIPTHLNVEDKAFFGLSVRQVMELTVGLSTSYWLWNQWPALTPSLRLGLAGACLVIALALALVRPAGRGLEEWAFVLLYYALTPRASVWWPTAPDEAAEAQSAAGWEEIAPGIAWPEMTQ
jgi:PrgI family protein